jgi:hypothetical protein
MKIKRVLNLVIISVFAVVSLATCTTTKVIPATEFPDVKGETWDYISLGSGMGTAWADHYVALMESDLGVKIVYHSNYVSMQLVGGLLQNVTSNEELREDIKGAEVITIGVGFSDMFWNAIWEYDNGLYDRRELRQKVKTFRETYDSMLDEVLKLTSSSDTIIQVMDFFFPFVAQYKEQGIYGSTKDYWNDFNESSTQSAQTRGIPAARVFQAFNGRNGEEDPVAKGYIDPEGRHASEQGREIIAAEFRKLGYQYASQ